MATMEPFAPWLRDLNRFVAGESVPAAFIPPADVIVSDDGVKVHMDVPGLRTDDLDPAARGEPEVLGLEEQQPAGTVDEDHPRRTSRVLVASHGCDSNFRFT